MTQVRLEREALRSRVKHSTTEPLRSHQAMKILERIVDGLIRQVVSIDNSQFGFVPGRGTTDAIFVVLQLQEK